MNTVHFDGEILSCQNYISGSFVEASGQEFSIYSPYTGSIIAITKTSTIKDIAQAVASAKTAQIDWALRSLKDRSQVLFSFRHILLREIDAISNLVSLESGKTLAEAKAGILKGIEVLEFALSLQNLDTGGKMEVSREVFCEYRRRPLGVVAQITPFNFPAMVPMWTIPIALALGNAYLWKPSDKTPLTAGRIAQCLTEAGLPDGLLNIVNGGQETAQALIDHPDIAAIGFVGSTPVAKAVFQRGSQLGKRVLALGGAKNHILLLPDADLDMSGRGISDSFTGCAGQRCMAASVLLAIGDCDAHIETIKNRAASLKLGKDMGAIISAEHAAFLRSAVDEAEKSGAKVILDGRSIKAPSEYPGGYWFGPTILDHVPPESSAAKTELFGPLLSIVRCKNISEALAIENKSLFGNACSVFTASGPLAEKVVRRSKAAMIGINIGVPVPREPFSFGGCQASKFGHGDITGQSSLDFWSDLVKVTTKWETQNDETWMS